MSLIDKMRKAREVEVEAGGRKFTIRRPTDEEAMAFGDSNLLGVVKKFVIGWDITEIDLIPGGDSTAVKFDPGLFAEWMADQPEVWEPLGTAILAAYKTHTDKREASAKE